MAMSSRSHRRDSGNALVLALLVGVVLLVGLLFVFVVGRDESSLDRRDESSTPEASQETNEEAASIPEMHAEPDEAAPRGAAPGTVAVVGTGAFEIRGSVVKRQSREPIAGAAIRFLPLAPDTLAGLTGDRMLLDGKIDADAVPRPIGDALLASLDARSSDDGRFTMKIPADARPSTLVVGGAGYATRTQIIPADAESPFELVIELAAGSAIRGRVTEADTGVPAVGMQVIASPERPGVRTFVDRARLDGPRAFVRADGTYEIAGLARREYRVVPLSSGTEFQSLPARLARAVVIEGDEPVTGVDFEVRRGGMITGRVTDTAGMPHASVQVNVARTSLFDDLLQSGGDAIAEMAAWSDETDENGMYRIAGLELGSELVVLAKSEDHAPHLSTPLRLTESERTARVDVVLHEGGSVSGIVLDEDLAVIAGEPVLVAPDYASLMKGGLTSATLADVKRTETDDEGRFIVRHLPDGMFSVSAGDRNPYSVFQPSGVTIEIIDGADVTGIEVHKEDASAANRDGELTGRVVDDVGEPLANVDVQIRCIQVDMTRTDRTKTDDNGAFRFEGFGDRPVTLEANNNTHGKTRLDGISGNDTDVEIVLARSASVTGIVLLPDGSVPDAPFRVRAMPIRDTSDITENMELAGMLPVLTGDEPWIEGNDDGTFALDVVPPGRVEIIAKAPGYAEGTTGELLLQPTQVLSDVTIYLPEGATVTGRVLREDGGVAAQASVTIDPITDDLAADTYKQMLPGLMGGDQGVSTNPQGVYRIHPVDAGSYRVSATLAGYAPALPVTVRVQPGQVVRVPDLVLLRGAAIEGRVTDNGEPMAGIMVQIVGSGPMRMQTTEANGRYSVEGLAPGDYMVAASDTSSVITDGAIRYKSLNVSLEAGEAREVDLEFGSGFDLRVKITNPRSTVSMATMRIPGGAGPEDYDPLDIPAALEAAKFQRGVAMIRPDGAFTMRDLEPGNYILEVLALPGNMMDMAAYSKMDRTPYHRSTVTIEDEDLEIEIEIDPPRQ